MKKEEILAKAQAERVDERETFISDRSMRWTYLVMAVTAGIFMIVRSVRDTYSNDLCSVVCLSAAAGDIYRFIKTKEKWALVAGVVGAAAGVVLAVLFFMER
ncbi:MAG: DUF6442 family protein [Lachnospiraceae bacterium]|nr:DUF6442 family protein [Ruminococcus sp.]MCM1274099.1 DUF6442 family protein [Lachnospiraceae bacterium]